MRRAGVGLVAGAGSAVGLALLLIELGHDPFDGMTRGLLDALACLVGFATLGRFIGLWRPRVVGDRRRAADC
jgi:hypothetical protein